MKNKDELLRLAADLSSLSESFYGLAESIKALAGQPEKEEKDERVKEETKADEKNEAEKETKAKPEKKYTLEEVRRVLSEKSSAGFTAEVRELLVRHGGAKLSVIPESEYAALIEEAGQLVKEEDKSE